MNDTELAQRIVDLIGGPTNVVRLSHCASRLRFELRDDSACMVAALEAMSEVVMVARQPGQVQVALHTGALGVHAEIMGLVAT
ncbi:PTS transporter subunit EIIB [Actinotalea sp. K2]|uniref:PTS transporter subunit EIIB n=1 Tax=Actinotalea sp. K2 TaxID=2939438 RepID=UPI0020181708|nr:PTS transporter subunit EIIB [Actinotalea sp. K2]MCL3862537.1 PTS transporter subunit EIIB [Actinotalea sp. K2]